MFFRIISVPVDRKGAFVRFFTVMKVICVGVMLTACGANHNSIYRYQPLVNGKSLTLIDAKQRAIIQSGTKTCTEPPPDVFSVYAQSLAASGKVSKSTDPTSLGVEGSLAYSSSEQGATISRTQAFNLLALQTYYNCLSSLNGDAGRLDAPIDRARLQRMMVSILAIEQLTGALRPPVIVIGASGSSGSAAAGEAVVVIDKAFTSAQTAKAQMTDATAKRGKLDDADPKCATLAASVVAGTVLTGDDLKKRADCVAADTLVASTTGNSSDATAHYEALKSASGGGNSNTAQTAVIDAKVIAATVRDEATVRQVTGAVQKIVADNMQQDETKFFCIRLLGDPDTQKTVATKQALVSSESLTAQCSSFLLASVAYEQDKVFGLMTSEARQEFDQQKVRIQAFNGQAREVAFANYWSSVLDAATRAPVQAKIAAKIDPIVAKNDLIPPIAAQMQALRAASDEVSARTAFQALPSYLQTMLAQ
jgi:hypothetical protein